jgi:homeobox protein cut-like
MLESELARLREENGDLKRQVGEMSSVEDKRKKAEAKVESMEEKVSFTCRICVDC